VSGPTGTRDERFVLAIDLGTGGPKVGLVSVIGEMVWHDHIAVATRLLPGGGAVQDAQQWWSIVTDASRRALLSNVIRREQVVAVCITGQWASVVPTGADGRPVGDCVLWMDRRGARHIRPIIAGRIAGYAAKNALTWIRRTGGAPSPGGGDPVSHMLLLDRDHPEVARAARWYLEPVDHLSMRFTGVAAASHASMTAAWLTDNRDLDRLEYDQKLVALAGIDITKLPPLRRTGSLIGPVLPAVAHELGLPDGVQVVTGLPDLHTAMCGAGAIGDYETHMAISTTAWIGASVPFKKTDVLHSIASVPGLLPGKYAIVDNHETGGRCLQWLRENVLADDGVAAEYDTLTTLAGTSPPGSGTVLFTPWLNGERSPVDDRTARGGFHNLSLATTRADMVRAVMEGVAFNNRWLHGYVESFAKRRLDPIRMIGGGAVSDLWCQIHADIMDRTIERVHQPLHAGIRGAALVAGIALGLVRPDEVRTLVHVDTTFTPDPANRLVYDRLAAEFSKLYRGQKAMAGRLNQIGRPPS
jgi:xylulokinase